MSLVRWSGFVAMLGGVLCVLLSPIQAWVFSGDESPPVVLAARPLLDAADRLHAAFGPDLNLDAYYFYGRMFFLVYLAAIVGLVGLHTLTHGMEDESECGSASSSEGWWSRSPAMSWRTGADVEISRRVPCRGRGLRLRCWRCLWC